MCLSIVNQSTTVVKYDYKSIHEGLDVYYYSIKESISVEGYQYDSSLENITVYTYWSLTSWLFNLGF